MQADRSGSSSAGVAPNKCQHDVVAAFAAYRRVFEPRARLTLIGGTTSARYLRAIQHMIGQLDLGDSVEILDNVDFRDLLAHFATADAFVCLSEHEGFCVPVLEAMELSVPVVAFAAAALPETVAGAGVLLEDKDPLAVACAVDAVLSDRAARDALVAAGRTRAGAFSLAASTETLITTITEWLAARHDG